MDEIYRLIEPIDREIVRFINQAAGQDLLLDRAVKLVAVNDLFKGIVVMAVFWALWFARRTEEETRRVRAGLLITAIANIAALAANRQIGYLLPHRPRPMNQSGTEEWFTLPLDTRRGMFETLNSFPSDHAVMFIGLSVGMLWVSRRAALFLIPHAVIVVLLPRIYMGLHYPSDMVAGALIALFFAWLGHRARVRGILTGWLLTWSTRFPATFYMLLATVSFLYATLFHSLVQIGYLIKDVLEKR